MAFSGCAKESHWAKAAFSLAFLLMFAAQISEFVDAEVTKYMLVVDLNDPTKREAVVSVTNGTTSIPVLESFYNFSSPENLTVQDGVMQVKSSVKKEVVFTYHSSDPIKAAGDENVATVTVKSTIGQRIPALLLTVKLPSGSVIKLDEGAPLVSSDEVIGSDGERIMITWRSSLGAGEDRTFFVVYTHNGTGGSSSVGGWIMALMISIISLGAVGWIYSRKRRIAETKHEANAMLTDQEKQIMEIIDHYKDKCLQTDIIRETGLSKSKISKVLRSMVVKGLIERKPYGKTNLVRRKK